MSVVWTPVAVPEQVKVTEGLADVPGARLWYWDTGGSGPVVILLHGLADDVGVWKATLEALSRRYRVIALDQIGFGKSDKPLLSYRVETFVDFLDGFHVVHEVRQVLQFSPMTKHFRRFALNVDRLSYSDSFVTTFATLSL